MSNLFQWHDYAVVVGTLLLSLIIGLYYGLIGKQQTHDDLLLGGKSMGNAPIAASMLVTYLSAVQVLGYPAEIYGFGSQVFMNTIVFIVIGPLSVYFFMTIFYKMQLTSVYEYLENRFESSFVRMLASFIFILQMTGFMGVSLFTPSIALSAFMGLKMWHSIIGLGVCATAYTSIGGLRAVVWTDVFQLFMILAGMFAIIIKGFINAGGVIEVFEKASNHGRLEFLNFTIDPFMRHNTLNLFLGAGFSCFTGFATHQPQVQRYCSLPTLGDAVRATIFTIPLSIFTMSLCLISGLAIFSSYVGCDPMALGEIPSIDAIVPFFVKNELILIPGMMGLFTACVFSATLSTLSSCLNSLAAVIWEDFFTRIPAIKRMSPKGQSNIIRFISTIYGVLGIIIAFGAESLGTVLAATMTALGALFGPLGAVFVMGVLMPFVNKPGAIMGMLTGFSVMLWITLNAVFMEKTHIVPLPFTADQCDNRTLELTNSTVPGPVELEYPQKLYTMSYTLYPFVGGIITFAVSTLVSLFTGGFCSAKHVNPKFLHPLVHSREKVAPRKEMKYSKAHYSCVIPAATPQYSKISPSPTPSPTNLQYYNYETFTYSEKKTEKLPQPYRLRLSLL